MNRPPPRILRGVQVDEKTASFFVDKAYAVLTDVVMADTALPDLIAKQGWSWGNPKGRERFLKSARAARGPRTLRLSLVDGSKKDAIFVEDLIVSNGDLLEVRHRFCRWQRHRPIEERQRTVLRIRRHALVRAVQRAGVRDVADVFAFLREAWKSLSLIVMESGLEHITPPGRCWLAPMGFEDSTFVGLLVERPVPAEPAVLKTVYRAEWVTDAFVEACNAWSDMRDDVRGLQFSIGCGCRSRSRPQTHRIAWGRCALRTDA